MKIYLLLPFAATLAFVVSCEKPQTEAEKNAQIEREVQQRLAAEHLTDEQKRLAQQQAELDAREKALAEQESATTTTTTAVATPREVSRVAATSVSEDSAPPRSYDTFYRKLEPYGAWRETENYGYVFQPREARSHDWRPYTDGRWAYTDAGWTWVSDEPFGWATYHYGRWTRLSGVGWVWVPGEEWAPAWVSWRKGDQNVGWAPLPPEARFDRNKGIHKWADNYYDIDAGEYVFIPNEDIGAENIQRSVIPEERNVTIVNQTSNVTNITYANTTIVNEGPNYDDLRAHSRRPLERMRIQREYDVERDQAPRASIRGETIQMITPIFTARVTERPRTTEPTLRQTTVERSRTGNQAEAESARAKMRAEATPPPDAPPKKFERPRMPESTATTAPIATATAAPMRTATAVPTATVTRTATVTPAATATPIAAVTATPIATATPAPTVKPTATPVPSVATSTPPPRPKFTPRATPIATIAPLSAPTAAPIATSRPRIAPPVATPAPAFVPPTATVAPSDAVQPAPAAAERPNQAALQAEQQRKRQEAMQKMMEQRRAPRANPPPVATPAAPVDALTTPPAVAAPARNVIPPNPAVATTPPPDAAVTPASAERPDPRRDKALRTLPPARKPTATPGEPEKKSGTPEP